MTYPKDYPLESFDPKLETILLKGARGENFTIRCQSEAQAHRLQHMLHSFRHKAKKHFGDSAPERWRPLYMAVVSRVKDEHGRRTLVHVFSRQDEFSSILGDIASDTESSLTPSTDPLAEFEPHNGKPEGSGG